MESHRLGWDTAKETEFEQRIKKSLGGKSRAMFTSERGELKFFLLACASLNPRAERICNGNPDHSTSPPGLCSRVGDQGVLIALSLPAMGPGGITAHRVAVKPAPLS